MQADMRYVYEIYLTGSFTRAAERLYLTQPALSMAIKKIEQQVGTPLFYRSRKPVTLTPAGECYLHHILDVRQSEKNLDIELDELRRIGTGKLRLGSTQYFNSYILPHALPAFAARYPEVEMTLLENNAYLLDDALSKDEADITIHNADFDTETLRGRAVFSDEVLLAVPDALVPEAARPFRLTVGEVQGLHFLDDTCPVADLALFAGTPFLLLSDSNQLRTRTLAICREKGFTPSVAYVLGQLETAWNFCRHGLGMTFVTNQIIAECDDPSVCYFHVRSEEARRMFRAIVPKKALMPQMMKDFLQEIRGLPFNLLGTEESGK